MQTYFPEIFVKKFLFLFFSIFIVLVASQSAHAKQIRVINDFNRTWLFEKDDWVGLHNASQMSWDDSKWQHIRLPHSWNAEDTFDSQRGYYRGYGWYRKHFNIDPTLQGKIIHLHFGAIFTQAQIWVNEIYFGEFSTGYTPIDIDVTKALKWDGDNLIAIRVNNIHNDNIPPGRWRMDYNCYGGIYREVKMIILSPLHLVEDELFVTTPTVSQKQSHIHVNVKIKNQSSSTKTGRVRCRLFDGDVLVAEFSQSVRLPAGLMISVPKLDARIRSIRLWSPKNPHLYSLRVTLFENEKPTDDLEQKIGFRTFSFDAEKGFFLNGELLKLRGLNRHQGYPGLANAVPVRLQIEDANVLKQLGANFVRCSHYPQHPAFLSACDSLGILVYEEVASWQHIGGNPFIEIMNRMLDGMIRRDRNHPSIILWGMMNEGRSVKMFQKLQKTAHRLDPTRSTSYAENHIKEAIALGTAFMPDVLGLNYNLKKYDDLHQNYPHLKLTNTECTNADEGVFGDFTLQIKSVLQIKSDLNFIDSRPYLGGSCIWCFHDYGTEYKPVWPIQKSGVVDVYRRFKEGAFYLQSRWRDEPFLHIAGHWTWPGDEGKNKDVYVWHNCDKVRLYLNGMEVKNKVNDHLWKVAYTSGELKAVGKKGNKTVKFRLDTAGEPQQLILNPLSKRINADGFDAVPVYAQIEDANNVGVPLQGKKVRFTISGPGKLIGIGGATSALTAAGSAAIIVQSTGRVGEIVVTAQYRDLAGECKISASR